MSSVGNTYPSQRQGRGNKKLGGSVKAALGVILAHGYSPHLSIRDQQVVDAVALL